MLYGEIIAFHSEIHTKHVNTLCGQNVELLNVKLAVRIVTTGLYSPVTICTASLTFNNSTFCPQCIYVFLCGSENKQRLFPYTVLTDWFL